MRILLIHNTYQVPGGEDGVFKTEAQLLQDFGHDVKIYTHSNSELDRFPFLKKIAHFLNLDYSKTIYQELRDVMGEFKPEVAHCHNTFFMLTSAVYYACKDAGVPVVQSLHNFRPFCINGLFLRDNKPCEKCLRMSPWVSVFHRCYRNSFFLSACAVRMNLKNRRNKILSTFIDVFITASEFGKNKLIECGIPGEKIVVKPNGIYPDRNVEKVSEGNFAVYVGRLSEEKGVGLLLEAWRKIPNYHLKIVGGGPLTEKFKNFIAQHQLKNVEMVGFVSDAECERLMADAQFVIVPSQCYENFPRIVTEAYALKKPIVASRIGSLVELIQDQQTGLLFDHDNVHDLVNKILWMIARPEQVQQMGEKAFSAYKKHYHFQTIYKTLLEVYERVKK